MKLSETGRRIISFPDKYAAFRHHISMYMGLPGLRGLWTAGHTDTAGNWYDWTQNALTLTLTGAPAETYTDLRCYFSLDGTNDYFTRADDVATSVTGSEGYIDFPYRGLTLGNWWYSTDATAFQCLMSKFAAVPNVSYYLAFNGSGAGDPVRFRISDDGTNADGVESSNTAAANQWHFTVGRFKDYDAGEELAVFLDGVKTTAATARAAIYDGVSAFEMGSGEGGLYKLTGRLSVGFLCAFALPDDMIGALFQQSRALYGV